MKKSQWIVPISLLIHLIIINSVFYLFTPETYFGSYAIVYYNLCWILISFSTNFYPTERKEKFYTNLHQFLQVIVLYGLSFFALYGFKGAGHYSLSYKLVVFAILAFSLTCYRALFYWLRVKYRMQGGNFRNVVVVGRDKNLKKIRKVFDKLELGYRYMGYFDDRTSKSKTYLGKMNDSFKYILENDIDYIYCIASRLLKSRNKSIEHFCR